MKTPGSLSRLSFVAPARGKLSLSGWWPVIRFGLFTVLFSLVFTVVALPFLGLSWWKIFRRCASIAAGLSLWVCICRLDRRSIRSYGLSGWKTGMVEFAFGVLLGLATLAIMLAIGLATGACSIRVTDDAMRLWRLLALSLPLMAAVSVLEELVFRGIILQPLLSWSRAGAVAVSSGLYAVVHLKSPEFILLTWLELIGLWVLGAVLALSYLRTGRLYLAIGLHAALAYGARINKLLVEFTDVSMAWLVGTSRLVNGLAGWVALASVGAVIWWAGSKLFKEVE